MASEDDQGASPQELLIEACRRNNPDLLAEVLADKPEAEITRLLNDTTTVMGNHLYHEAASQGHYEVIDALLDQPGFECDPINRLEGDTPLHAAVRWISEEPSDQWGYGFQLVMMMLEAGSDPRVRNKAGLTALQLVNPEDYPLRGLIETHVYAAQNQGDFVSVDAGGAAAAAADGDGDAGDVDDDDEFSGSDEEDRAEWEQRKRGGKPGRETSERTSD
ncbi:uncharacterized protein UV8b_02144 [Ustilaginoidea virens]|uniref:Ankyrin repeat protein n=1 Tax=Ustilaginoidea virens TaxID=1159556 RepID=A0A8E5HMA6_USTVR|nr:uncharacterized protein UV8b_02144 [Ustilaginoidea virens]QUC17903.1 hypothetical protein UV8b_02144 [Ustilaginoidea virens]